MSFSYTILLFHNFLFGEALCIKFGMRTQIGHINVSAKNQISWRVGEQEKNETNGVDVLVKFIMNLSCI